MPQLNMALRNRQADSLGTAFGGGSVEGRTGLRPGADVAVSGTLLFTITLPATPFAVAANGSIAKAGTWEANATATGTCGWIRVFNTAKTIWTDFQIGTDATMADANVVTGNPVRVDSATLNQPSG
jgi:sulfur carrier protein ThiS